MESLIPILQIFTPRYWELSGPHEAEPAPREAVTDDLTLARLPRYRDFMRMIAWVVVVLALAGCTKHYSPKKPAVAPAPKVPVLPVSSLGTPSGLLVQSGDPVTSDRLPFDFPLNKGYSIEGGWRGPNQVKGTTGFQRIGDFAVRKSDNADVDPKEVMETLEKWIGSSGAQSTQTSGAGSFSRSMDYGTQQTLGRITYSVQPESAAKEVKFHFEVNEAPRR